MGSGLGRNWLRQEGRINGAPAHNCIPGVAFDGEDVGVARSKARAHGMRQHVSAEVAASGGPTPGEGVPPRNFEVRD
jgi:hypothetical protein